MKRKSVICLMVIMFLLMTMLPVQSANYIYYGSTDKETVKTMQTKLKNWGYYDGAVDGVFGAKTEKAVRYFQQKNGLKVDGKAGQQTLKAMGIMNWSGGSSGSSNSSGSSAGGASSGSNNNYSNSDVNLLARCIYGEARGEPYTGQVAVAAVILNRVKHKDFPSSVSGVIYQNGAFDAVSDGQINLTPNDSAIKAAKDAIGGWDPTNGAIYYYNPATATNSWIWSRQVALIIGKHHFAI